MPKRLAIVGPYQVEVLEYQDAPLAANEVLVQTELASGKHGTTFGMFDGRTFEGQRFNLDWRLFVEAEEEPAQAKPSTPGKTGTTGVGTIVEVGAEVTRWKVGERVFGFMDVRETNLCRIHATVEPATGRVLAFAAIDNLWKGAASQAVQDLNLMLGRPEVEGLGPTAAGAAAGEPVR